MMRVRFLIDDEQVVPATADGHPTTHGRERMAPYVPHLPDQPTHSARAVVTALPYLFSF